jgi:hypothetical protein
VVARGRHDSQLGDFTVKQSSDGMQIVSVVGGGTKVKDEVRVSFYIIARK